MSTAIINSTEPSREDLNCDCERPLCYNGDINSLNIDEIICTDLRFFFIQKKLNFQVCFNFMNSTFPNSKTV